MSGIDDNTNQTSRLSISIRKKSRKIFNEPGSIHNEEPNVLYRKTDFEFYILSHFTTINIFGHMKRLSKLLNMSSLADQFCLKFHSLVFNQCNLLQVTLIVVVMATCGKTVEIRPSLNQYSELFKGLSEFVEEKPSDECFMNTSQLIHRNGYPVKEHQMKTKDGYYLTMFQIPYGLNESMERKGPVLVKHGLMSSSDDWVLCNKSLPFILADSGYEVWLGNSRGNIYSMKHESLNDSDAKFWNFSLDQKGESDIPTMMDYIRDNTGRPGHKLTYVGHSMGCAEFLVCMIKRPDLQSFIYKAILLAPAVKLANMKTPLALLLYVLTPLVKALFDLLTGGGPIMSKEFFKFMRQYGPFICSSSQVCNYPMFLLVGANPPDYPKGKMSMILGHLSLESWKSVAQLAQYANLPLVRALNGLPCLLSNSSLLSPLKQTRFADFANYDYGCRGNMQHYNQPNPILYNLSSVKTECMVMYSKNDLLVQPKDAQETQKLLSNANNEFSKQVPDTSYNHLDLIMSDTAKENVYDNCLKFLAAPPQPLRTS